jgi:hypothetical protein
MNMEIKQRSGVEADDTYLNYCMRLPAERVHRSWMASLVARVMVTVYSCVKLLT